MKYSILFLSFFVLFSCSKKQEKDDQNKDEQSALSAVSNHIVKETVRPLYQKEVENWEELKVLDGFIERFKKGSPNEFLSNALELEGLIKNIKDSVKPLLFNTSAFEARVNILYNESLRLSDMTLIPSIKAKEVNTQADKILNAYASLNSKINTIFTKRRFEDAIDIDEIKYIGLDSTQIDSVSKKAIGEQEKLRIEQKLETKNNLKNQ